jgi:hypothetical protein
MGVEQPGGAARRLFARLQEVTSAKFTKTDGLRGTSIAPTLKAFIEQEAVGRTSPAFILLRAVDHFCAAEHAQTVAGIRFHLFHLSTGVDSGGVDSGLLPSADGADDFSRYSPACNAVRATVTAPDSADTLSIALRSSGWSASASSSDRVR